MGYRSDVAYVIKFSTFEDRDAFVNLQIVKNDKYVTSAINECKTDYKVEPLITFTVSDVKWYGDFPDVKPHMQFLRDAADLYEARYRFVALGEDGVEDVRVQDDESEMYDYIAVTHHLDIDFPKEPDHGSN